MVLHVWKYSRDVSPPRFVRDRIIDNASSVLWVERYQESGEFEIIMRATPELLRYFSDNELIITRQDTDRAMIVDNIDLTTSPRDGDILTISGKSAESIMNKRTITQRETFTQQSFTDGAALCYFLIQENIASYWYYHSDGTYDHSDKMKFRFIPFLKVGNVTIVNSVPMESQPFGMNLGKFIESVCGLCDMGFRIRYDKTDGSMYYEFYRGTDKSKDIIFSKESASMSNTEYRLNKRTYYNRAIAGGEGEGRERVVYSGELGSRASGFELQEEFIDMGGVSSNTAGIDGDPHLYKNLLLNTIATRQTTSCVYIWATAS